MNKAIWSFPVPQEKYVDILPALPLNNCKLLCNLGVYR
jgi:hypothetical protein